MSFAAHSTTIVLHPIALALLASIPVDRFVPAADATYNPTRDYVRWFSQAIRRPEDP